jgi:hypothetical protein
MSEGTDNGLECVSIPAHIRGDSCYNQRAHGCATYLDPGMFSGPAAALAPTRACALLTFNLVPPL